MGWGAGAPHRRPVRRKRAAPIERRYKIRTHPKTALDAPSAGQFEEIRIEPPLVRMRSVGPPEPSVPCRLDREMAP